MQRMRQSIKVLLFPATFAAIVIMIQMMGAYRDFTLAPTNIYLKNTSKVVTLYTLQNLTTVQLPEALQESKPVGVDKIC